MTKNLEQSIIKCEIPFSPITKKNSSRLVRAGGRSFILPSKAYSDYYSNCALCFAKSRTVIDFPVNVKCTYYMSTRRKVDLVNLLEATCDVLVGYGILSDDNSQIVVSHDGSRVFYDKQRPRTEIAITKI